MDVVLIGASDRSSLWRHGSLEESEFESFVEEYARFLAERFDNVIVTPDDGVYTDVALRFGDLKGKRPVGYYPDKDTYYGYDHLKPNFPKYDIRPIGGDWYTLNAELTKQAKTVISLGWAPGVMIEGCFIKYHQKYGAYKDPSLKGIHWFIDSRCIDQRLPKGVEEQIGNIHYFNSLRELGSLLDENKEKLE